MYVIKLGCNCGRPWAYVIDGALYVESRHNGNTHTNSITVAKLLALMKGSTDIGSEVLLNRLIHQLGIPASVFNQQPDEMLSDQCLALDKST